MKIFKILIISIIFFLNIQIAHSAAFDYGYTSDGFKYVIHKHNESSYQHQWCRQHNGIEEFETSDKTRVDCLTDTHAVEFDFANKWAESIGQALHYAHQTGKKAKVIIILENPKKQMIYFKRVKILSEIYNFDVEYITPDILNIKEGKCMYSDCKCHNHKNIFSKKLKSFLYRVKNFGQMQ